MLTYRSSPAAPRPDLTAGEVRPAFADTTPFRFDETLEPAQRVGFERHRVREQWRLTQTLANLKNLEIPIRIGLPESGAFFSAMLWTVDAPADRMVFRATAEQDLLDIVRHPGRLWGAAYSDNCKVQFDLRGRTLAMHGGFWNIRSYLPSAMYVLPRREGLRARHVSGTEPRIQFALPGGGPAVSLPIHDISTGGLSFLLRPDEGRLAVGNLVDRAEIELAPGEFLFADLRICNVTLHDEDGGRLRFGCAWTLLSQEALSLIKRWTSQSQRRRGMLTLDL